jgi:hypothetical protein
MHVLLSLAEETVNMTNLRLLGIVLLSNHAIVKLEDKILCSTIVRCVCRGEAQYHISKDGSMGEINTLSFNPRGD